MTKAQVGARGGKATVAAHGREHMARIGRLGAAATWQRYHLKPAGVSGWLMVDRQTGEVRATIGRASF